MTENVADTGDLPVGGVRLLRGEPRFARWVGAETVSMVGTSVSTIALPVVVFDLTGSAAATGVLFALRALPYLFFGLLAGPIADRGNRRRLIIGGNLAEGLLVATVPVAAALDLLTLWHVYVVAFAASTVFTFSDAAVFGAVPALVGRRRLAAANGLLGSLASATEIVGPMIAGVLLVVVSPVDVLWIDTASFVIAAGVQATIRSDFRDGTPVERRRIADQLRRVRVFIRRERTVATLLAVGFGNSLAFGMVLGLVVPYAALELGVGSQDGRLGVLFAALGLGSLMTGLLFDRLFRVSRIPVLTPTALAVAGVSAALLAVVGAWFVAAVVLMVFSASIALTIVTGITYRQLAATDDLRSSVNVVGRMIAWGGQPFGAFVGAAIASLGSIVQSFAVAAVIMLGTAVVARFALVRSDPQDPEVDGTSADP